MLWLFCEVQDRAAVSCFDRLIDFYASAVQERATAGGERAGPFKPVRRDVAGVPVVGLELQGPAANDLGTAFQPAYAQVGNHLVISSYRPALERMIVNSASRGPGSRVTGPRSTVQGQAHPPDLGPGTQDPSGAAAPSQGTGRIILQGAPLASQLKDLTPHLTDLIAYRRLRAQVEPEVEKHVGASLREEADRRRREVLDRARASRPAAPEAELQLEADREVTKWLWQEFNRRVELEIQSMAGTAPHAAATAEANQDLETWIRHCGRLDALRVGFQDVPEGRRFEWTLSTR